MIRLRSAALGLVLLLAGTACPHAEHPQEPFQLIRDLNRLQDAVAEGRPEAHLAQKTLMAALPAKMAAATPEMWEAPRNRRAALGFVLNGGAPRILRTLLSQGRFPEEEQELAKGVLAYAEGRDAEASTYLAGVDARSLSRSLGGPIALVQASLVSEKDPGGAMTLLEQARLLSPGTLVEEAALRRQILLLPVAKEAGRLEFLLRRYIRQFGKSFFASAFWRQLAIVLANLENIEHPKQLAKLERVFGELDKESQQSLYLLIARQGLANGKSALARFAAILAARIPGGKANLSRAQLYEAAALIVTEDYDHALTNLMEITPDGLTNEDAVLRDAVLFMARQIRLQPRQSDLYPAPADEPTTRAHELSEIGLRTIERAQALVADVDALWREKPQ